MRESRLQKALSTIQQLGHLSTIMETNLTD